MFGNESKPSRIYSFKCKSIHEGLEATMDQIHLAHLYRNRLIEQERTRREQVDQAVRDRFPAVFEAEQQVAALEAEVESLLEAIRKRNQQTRRRTATPEDRDTLKEIKARLKIARADRKESRAQAFADPDLKAELANLDARINEDRKAARKGSDLYWGNYLVIEQSLGNIRTGAPPRFRRWTGEGSIAVQVQGGMDWPDALISKDQRVRVQMLPLRTTPTVIHRPATIDEMGWGLTKEIARRDRILPIENEGKGWQPKEWKQYEKTFRAIQREQTGGDLSRIDRRYRYLTRKQLMERQHVRTIVLPPPDRNSARSISKGCAIAWLRVGTTEGRAPKWMRVEFHLHRQPPEGSRIKWAYLHRRLIGRRVSWEIQFVLERDHWDREDQAVDGTAGLDVGWRIVKDGLRVAYYAGSDGDSGQLVIPHDWLTAWSKVESLQSIRDRNFDAIRERLAVWLDGHEDTPEWLAERTKHLRLWKAPGKLAAVVWRWKNADSRFEGDDEILMELEEWRQDDRHLHDWQEAQRGQVIRRRDDLYRHFTGMLRRRYKTVRIEATNWREMQSRPTAEAESSETAARVNAHIAAVGRLLQFVREHCSVVEPVDPKFSTLRCHYCGQVDRFDSATEIFHTCSECGTVWDQDMNAAINLRDWVAPVEEPAIAE